MSTGRFKKILIVKPSSLGDIVHSLPFLSSVKDCFPKAEIHWVVAKGFEDLLQEHPMITRLIVINKDQWKKITGVKTTLRELRTLFGTLKGEGYDLVVDLQGLLRSGVIAMATGSSMRVGFREAREGGSLFYTHKVEGGEGVHAVDRYLKVASFLGCDTSKVTFPMTESPYPLPFDERYAVLVPGARWKTKRWPAENFAELAAKLPLRSVIVGGKSDSRIARQIVKSSDGKAISLTGKTGLRELSSVMKGAVFVVTNDSGPMHFAAAHGVPVFALFGPTDPAQTGPYGKGHTIITADHVDCAPCFKKRCNDLKCMESISADIVIDAINSRGYIS
jgi:lipopolysaccharide heptosyltransferase I